MRTGKGECLVTNGRSGKLLAVSIRKSLMAMQMVCVTGGLTLAGSAWAQTSTPAATTNGTAANAAQSTSQNTSSTNQNSTPPPSTKKAVQLEQVTVTGSNIRGVDMETALPTITITRQDIQRQGFATVGQLLQNLPAAATPDLSRGDAASLGPNQGGTFIDLRGLGAQRTLVLVDGERIGAVHGGYTDISVIPAAIVDHIDILGSGASAVYGSDAIAGVINIITIKNFQGVQIDTYAGEYAPHEDGTQAQYSVTGGSTTERNSLVGSVSYQYQGSVWGGSRPYSAYPYTANYPYFGLTSQPPNSGIITNSPLTNPNIANDHTLILNPGGNSTNLADYSFMQPRIYSANGNVTSLANTGSYIYNYNNLSTILSPNKTKNLYLADRYKITNHITAHFEFGYNQSWNGGAGGPSYLYSGQSANSANMPQFPIVLSAQSYYNPYNAPGQTPQAVQFVRAFPQILYTNDSTSKNYRYSGGLEGDFSLGDHVFNWDAYYYDSKLRDDDIRPGQYNLINVTQALGPSFMQNGQVVCGTPGHVIAGCVPLNPLGSVTQQMLNYIAIDNNEHTGYDESAFVADISGDVYELPGGDLTVAAGITHRDESGFDDTDPFATAGYSSDYSVQPNHGSFNLNEGYMEVYAPLLKDLPGVQSLSLDVAQRWSYYSNFGSTRNYSVKLAWKPIDDVMVRASYSTNFRAPTVNDLYQGLYLNGGFTDPCDAVYGPAQYGYSSVVAQRCQSGFGGLPAVSSVFRQTSNTGVPVTAPNSAGITNTYAGGNPNLKPETAYNGDVGMVYSPSWLPGFNATVDWWNYNIRNLITGISNNQVLADCYEFGITSACSQFQREGGNGPLAGQIINLMNLETNAGWLKERGWDFGASYALPEYSFGKFKLALQGTYVATNNVLPTIGAPVQYTAGTAYGNLDGAVWRVRGNFKLSWDWHNFGADWTVRYFSPIKGSCAYPPPTTTTVFPCTLPNNYEPGVGISPETQFPSVTFNDLQLHWNAPWKATFSLGVNNIFNRVGPYIYGGGFNAGTDAYYDYNASYDIGRFVYMRYQQKF